MLISLNCISLKSTSNTANNSLPLIHFTFTFPLIYYLFGRVEPFDENPPLKLSHKLVTVLRKNKVQTWESFIASITTLILFTIHGVGWLGYVRLCVKRGRRLKFPSGTCLTGYVRGRPRAPGRVTLMLRSKLSHKTYPEKGPVIRMQVFVLQFCRLRISIVAFKLAFEQKHCSHLHSKNKHEQKFWNFTHFTIYRINKSI